MVKHGQLGSMSLLVSPGNYSFTDSPGNHHQFLKITGRRDRKIKREVSTCILEVKMGGGMLDHRGLPI